MADNNIQNPTHVRPSMPPNNWRSQFDPRSRQKVIARIMDTLRKQTTQPVELAQVEKVARTFEEKIFNFALDQQDYLKKILFKMRAIEGWAQRGVANSSTPYPATSVPNPLDPATGNVQSQGSNHSQMPLQTLRPPQPQPYQIISSKTPSSNLGFPSVASSVPAVNAVIQAPGSNFACQSSNISKDPSNLKRKIPDQWVPSNPMNISRAQEQQRQHIRQPVSRNYENPFFEEQQARNQLANQNTSRGNTALTMRKNYEQSISRLSQPMPTQQHGSCQGIPVQGKVAALQPKATSQQSSYSSPMNQQNQSHSTEKHILQPDRIHSVNSQRPGAQSIAHNIGSQKAPTVYSSSQWVEPQGKMISQALTENMKPSHYASSQPHSLLRPVAGTGQSGTLGSLEVSKTSEAFSHGEKQGVVEAWRENAYQRIITMRSKYMSRLEELHSMLHTKLKQLISQGDHSNKHLFENLKENDKMVERILRVLQIPKDKLVPRHEACLDDWENKIVSYLSKFVKAKNTCTSLQQQKQVMNQHESVKPEEPSDLPQIHQEKRQSSLPMVISPGISPSTLLSECQNEEKNLVAQTPIQRLLNCVSSMSHHALKSSVDDMYSVINLTDRLEASAPNPGAKSSLGQDLAETTWCDLQETGSELGETRRHISLTSRKMWNGLETPRKIPRVEAYSYSNKLKEEIQDVNQKLIDTQVNICDEKDMNLSSTSGILIKCLFSGVSVNPSLFRSLMLCSGSSSIIKVQPLHLLVPTDYPKCSPIILDKFPSELDGDFLDISSEARSKLDRFLRVFNNPITVSEIARTWDVCAREVITELAEKYGGGSFSSRYGKWENCLETV